MPTPQRTIAHSVESHTLAETLERLLDKGVVIAGDIKIKLVDVELLTIQIRLVITSVDKAREIGLDWWATNPAFSTRAKPVEDQNQLAALKQRLDAMEARYGATAAPVESGSP